MNSLLAKFLLLLALLPTLGAGVQGYVFHVEGHLYNMLLMLLNAYLAVALMVVAVLLENLDD